jgi:hypothetical protein
MKLTIGILAVGMMTGGVWAQSPHVVNNVQSTVKTVPQNQASATHAAPGKAATSPQAAKPVPGAPAKSAAQPLAAKPAVAKPVVPAGHANPVHVAAVTTPQSAPATKKAPASHAVIVAKEAAPKTAAKPPAPGPTKVAASASPAAVSKVPDASKAAKPDEKKWAMTGKRDPFFSPVVQQPTGSGCSSGKKCLDIGQINLRGVVKSETGFIAVVTNSLNKAYFLRENDPVFNGYVVKITGDAVVFQQTVLDKLGKPLSREVVKRIFTPAV